MNLSAQDSGERQAFRSIAAFVVAVHLALIFWAWIDYETPPPPKKTVKLVARTIQLNPQPVKIQREARTAAPKVESFEDVLLDASKEIAMKEEPLQELPKLEQKGVKATPQKKIEIPQKKKTAPSPPPPRPKQTHTAKSVAKAKPAPKPAAKAASSQPVAAAKPVAQPDPKKRALLSQAQAKIANIQGASTSTKRSELKVPEYHPVATIASEEGQSSGELSYRDELACRLQLLLKLPESGKVQIKLTLSKTGKFVKLTVANSPSGANRNYIEKTLPTLSLPSFGEQFGGAAEHTFSITLTSDL